MSSLFKSKTKTKTEASAVPISYEPLATPNFSVGGRRLLQITPQGDSRIGGSAGFNRGIARGQRQTANQRNRLLDMRRDLKGNMNPFIQARVRPLEERLDNTLDDQSRAFARRGIFGSLSENELNKTRFLGEREIGDARAMATDEALNQILNVEGQIRGANQDDVNLTTLRVKDELARLGLSAEVLGMLLGNRRQTTQVAGGTTSNSSTPAPASIIGSILSAF